MHVLTKEELRNQLVTAKHKLEQAEFEIKQLSSDLNELKSLVVSCFVDCPFSHGDPIVLAHKYGKICDFMNKE